MESAILKTTNVSVRPKLTQYLIDKGYVTEDQCSEALQRQVVFGGRIGTNLLELFYINDEQLLEALSYAHHTTIADPEKLKAITHDIVDLIPEDLARKHKVVPFEASKGRIHLAMIDPTDMEAADEISFITGMVIKPFVTTETKMGFLLEKFYRVQRERRFISLPEEEQKRRREWEEKKKQLEEEKAAALKKEKEAVAENAPGLNESGQALRREESETEPQFDLTTFEGSSQKLAQAKNRDEIAGTLLSFANFSLERAALFIIKGDQVQGWKAGGVWKKPEHIEKIHFSFHEPTLFHDVAESRKPYKGPLLEIDIHKKIITALGAPYPKEVMVFPMAIRKKVFCVLYGDNAISNDSLEELQEIQKIALKASLAFEVSILKAKILFQN